METNEVSEDPTIIFDGELWKSTMCINLSYLKHVPHLAAERRIYDAV